MSISKFNDEFRGKYFRWVVPDLESEITFTDSKYTFTLPEDKSSLKEYILRRLADSKTARKGLQFYKLAIETHQSGKYHLDLLLTFTKTIRLKFNELDFLLNKHGKLTKYRNLNHSIIQYNQKEDTPLTNIQRAEDPLMLAKLKTDPFNYLLHKMKQQNPLHFDLGNYVSSNNLMEHIKGWSSVKNKLRDAQQYYANLTLTRRPGIRYITRQLIQQELTPQELLTYDSWPGYQRLVGYINQIHTYGCNRPFKSLQPLLVGPPNVGKTSLILQLQKHIPVYYKNVHNWFPSYQSNVYKLINWDQFTLSGMKYPQLLKFLQGLKMDLEFKGGSTLRYDNQLVMMTSNMSLQSHLRLKFGHNFAHYQLAKANLSVRIDQIVIPEGLNLFLILKLIQPNKLI